MFKKEFQKVNLVVHQRINQVPMVKSLVMELMMGQILMDFLRTLNKWICKRKIRTSVVWLLCYNKTQIKIKHNPKINFIILKNMMRTYIEKMEAVMRV